MQYLKIGMVHYCETGYQLVWDLYTIELILEMNEMKKAWDFYSCSLTHSSIAFSFFQRGGALLAECCLLNGMLLFCVFFFLNIIAVYLGGGIYLFQ